MYSQLPGDLLPNRFPDLRSSFRLSSQDFGRHSAKSDFRQVAPILYGQPLDLSERRLMPLGNYLLAGVGQREFDLATYFRSERFIRLVLRVGRCQVTLTRSKGVFDPAMNLSQNDPLLPDLMVRQEAAG